MPEPNDKPQASTAPDSTSVKVASQSASPTADEHEKSSVLTSINRYSASLLAMLGGFGGLWTLITFFLLRTSERSGVELDKLKADLEKARIDLIEARRKFSPIDSLNASISSSIIPYFNSDKIKFIQITLSMINNGNARAIIAFSDASTVFYISRIEDIYQDGHVKYGPKNPLRLHYAQKEVTELTIEPGGREEVHAIQVVNQPGVYLVRFSTKSITAGGGNYSATAYVNIDESRKEKKQ